MNTSSLADWIKQLLTQPIVEINRKYSRSENYLAEKEVESLLGMQSSKYRSSDVSADTVHELHLKIRDQKCEAAIWDAVIFRLSEPLPSPVAHDLIDRRIIVSQLGHTRQNDDVQWRLASLVDEALLTLVHDLFTDSKYTASELEELLARHPEHFWLLEKWEHWALRSSQVKEMEKEIVWHRWARAHPKQVDVPPSRALEVPTLEKYLEIIAAKERERLRAHWEEKEAQLRAERTADEKRLEVKLTAERILPEEEIQRIYSSREPEELLSLARNPHISMEWIQKLLNCYHVKGSRQIREAAERNIQSRTASIGEEQ
jgi:hypothetical protein